MVIKNKLRVYRAMHDLTQEQLAERVEVTRQTINAIEQGKYNPSLDLAFRLARLFGVKIEDLFVYDEDENEEEAGKNEKWRKK